MSRSTCGLPPDGIKALDLARVLIGPLSTTVFADLGADVIKVEHPEREEDTLEWGIPSGDTQTSYYYSVNRDKWSLGLDLGAKEGICAVRIPGGKLCPTTAPVG